MRYFLKIVTVTMRYSLKIVTVTMYSLFRKGNHFHDILNANLNTETNEFKYNNSMSLLKSARSDKLSWLRWFHWSIINYGPEIFWLVTDSKK